ncbi:hypothetical protein F5Y01DRAFT_315848 [Xylaria sp. FL0043]|nr:hypothetical protein F5Y01DRAFT_315848 [Xylaria sp. FL0043]
MLMRSSADQTLTASIGSGQDPSQASRKRKRNRSELTRAVRACDRCKKRKIRCNGTQPCVVCTTADAGGTFDAAYNRGRPPAIPRSSGLEAGCNNATIASGFASSASRRDGDDEWSRGSAVRARSQANGPDSSIGPLITSIQSSPEPSCDDTQGQYIGPTSEVAFLLRVQKRLHQAISKSQASPIFTFGDAPLPTPDFMPSFCMMLPRNDAQRLLDRYFNFAMPTYRFLHRPQAQNLFDEFYDTLGTMRYIGNAPANTALLFMVFVQARVYMPEQDLPGPLDLRSYSILPCRRASAHKGKGPYTMDVFLSVALGRPRTFHDDDITAELPACLDDDELAKPRVMTSRTFPSQMFASLAHIK